MLRFLSPIDQRHRTLTSYPANAESRNSMCQFYQFLAKIQADGRIGDDEVASIREQISRDGQLDIDDVKLLVELYCDAQNRSPAYDELFFSVLEQVFLGDGQITPSEEFYLLKLLYSDREIREPEREFLRR